MADTFTLEIITPNGVVFEGDVRHVRAPGREGSFGVLPGHTPFITPLQVGVIEAQNPQGSTDLFSTSGGVAEVHGDRTVVLAETAEKREEINVERAREAMERAKKRLESDRENVDYERARSSLLRAINRIKVAEEG